MTDCEVCFQVPLRFWGALEKDIICEPGNWCISIIVPCISYRVNWSPFDVTGFSCHGNSNCCNVFPRHLHISQGTPTWDDHRYLSPIPTHVARLPILRLLIRKLLSRPVTIVSPHCDSLPSKCTTYGENSPNLCPTISSVTVNS